jgi:hypothetical protein
MHQVQLTERLYQEAQRRAIEAGFTTVDEYVADVLFHDLELSSEKLDDLFTCDVIRELDRISMAAKAGGKTYSPDELKEHFRKRSEVWQADRTSH